MTRATQTRRGGGHSAAIPFQLDTSVSADGISPIAFAGELVVTGGTGRFAGASGTLSTQGGYCFVRNAGFFLLDGTVTIPR